MLNIILLLFFLRPIQSLSLSNQARKGTTLGEIVNLMAVDAIRYLEMTNLFNSIWRIPLHMALALYLLWGILGSAIIAGFFSLLIMMPFHFIIVTINKKLQVCSKNVFTD